MRNRKHIALILVSTLIFSVVTPDVKLSDICRGSAAEARAASPSLSKTSMTVQVSLKKVLKMKNSSKKVTWSIESGRDYIKLKKKKAKKVTIVGVNVGKAVVKATIRYSASNIKTYKCKVRVKAFQWDCPRCGELNTGEYCSNCGYHRTELSPTQMPDASDEPVYTQSPSATVAPVVTPPVTYTQAPVYTPAPAYTTGPSGSADSLTDRMVVMRINEIYYVSLQMYSNTAATAFYNGVVNGTYKSFAFGPDESDELFSYLGTEIRESVSNNNSIAKGELFLYGSWVLKLSKTAHTGSLAPTRIGVIRETDTFDTALQANKDGKTLVEFMMFT